MLLPYISNYFTYKHIQNGRSGDRIPVGLKFSAPVQTGPGSHPVPCAMGTGSFPGVKSGPGLKLTPHPLLVPWSRMGRAIPLPPPLWALRPVQSLSACTRVHYAQNDCHELHILNFVIPVSFSMSP